MPSTFFPELKVKRLSPDVPMPAYAHDGDAGLDLVATESVTLYPGESCKMGSGVSMAIPYGFAGVVIPRSGLGSKGLVIKNGLGLIDATYRGEIGLTLHNNNPTHCYEDAPTKEETEKDLGTFGSLFSSLYKDDGKKYLVRNKDGVIHVHKGDRVAQLVIIPVAIASLIRVDDLDATARGEGGFGSTGVRHERP